METPGLFDGQAAQTFVPRCTVCGRKHGAHCAGCTCNQRFAASRPGTGEPECAYAPPSFEIVHEGRSAAAATGPGSADHVIAQIVEACDAIVSNPEERTRLAAALTPLLEKLRKPVIAP
jgi:hypothetical protein